MAPAPSPAPPRRSRRGSNRMHSLLKDDNSSLSSGCSSGAGITYTMPAPYKNSKSRSDAIQRAQTKQLKLLPPRPIRSRSTMTMKSDATHVSGDTHTSRVSKVSIRPRDPVLEASDPLSRAMQDAIQNSAPLEQQQRRMSDSAAVGTSPPSEIGAQQPPRKATEPTASPSQIPTELTASPSSQIPSEVPLTIEEEPRPPNVIDTSVVSVLPPPPPLDPSETYSMSTSDVIKMYCRRGHLSNRNHRWRMLACLGVIVFLVVVGAIVVSLVFVMGHKDKGDGENNAQVAPTMAPSSIGGPIETTTQPTALPPTTMTPNFAPVQAPTGVSVVVPNLEQLLDYFSSLDPATSIDLTDASSPQYRGIEWLAQDVEANQFALSDIRVLQRGSLAIFYYSTLGDIQWESATGWLDSTLSECVWFGVLCEDGLSLTSMILSENNLGGKISHELGFLESLQTINLFGNAIGGTIPTHFGKLNQLKTMLLDTNDLTGSVPSTVGLLQNLESLALHENTLEGSIPDVFGSLSVLQSLRLENNNIAGSLPPSLVALTSLTALIMNGNQLTGAIPSEIGLLTNLEEIYLHSNSFGGSLPTEMGLLTRCNFLVLADNSFVGPIPETLGYAEYIVGLSLSNNTMTGTVPSSLGLLQNLQFLQLDGNEFVGEVPLEVCSLNLAVDVDGAVVADCQEPDPEIICDCCTNC